MSTSKYIDRICAVVLIFALLLTVVFMNGEAIGLTAAEKTSGYEDRIFDTSRVHSIDLLLDDWDGFIAGCENEEYVDCTVVIDGHSMKHVGIRAKGNTSLSQVKSMDSERYSFKLEFDHYDKNKTYYGLDKLCLNNIIQDNTYMKDYLTYRMMNEFGVRAPLTSYAYITVNGSDWGLYLAVEAIEDSFLERNYTTADGNLYKPDSMNMGAGRGNRPEGDAAAPADGTNPVSGDAAAPPDGADPASGDAAAPPDGGNPASGDAAAPPDDQNPVSGDVAAPSDGMNPSSGDVAAPSDGENPFSGDDAASPDGGNPASGDAAASPDGADPASSDAAAPPDGGNMDFGKAGVLPDGENTPFNKDFFGKNGQNGQNGQFENGKGSSDVKLQYTDDEISSYTNIFDNAKTKASEKDEKRLIASLKSLSEESDLEDVLDIDQVLRYFVVHNYVVNGDSYTGSMIHNYYLYEEDGALSMIPWDYNLAFGGFQNNKASDAINDPIDTPLSVGSSDSRPMIDWIFSSEEYTSLYHDYFEDFLESCDPEAIIRETKELIAPYVEKDPTKFCTYEEFETGVSTLETFITLRTKSVRGQLDGTIPSTKDGQSKDSSSLINADSITLSDMGTNNMGGGMDNMRGGKPGGRS